MIVAGSREDSFWFKYRENKSQTSIFSWEIWGPRRELGLGTRDRVSRWEKTLEMRSWERRLRQAEQRDWDWKALQQGEGEGDGDGDNKKTGPTRRNCTGWVERYGQGACSIKLPLGLAFIVLRSIPTEFINLIIFSQDLCEMLLSPYERWELRHRGCDQKDLIIWGVQLVILKTCF